MLITDPLDLAEKLAPARETGVLALDTEFVWERTYYPSLGLIQFATDATHCHLIDTLACEDLTALGQVIADPKVVKVLHDAPQDLQIIYRAVSVMPCNVFDTRLACGFIGKDSTQGLSALLNTLLGVELEKSETRTNWLQRPLSPAQIVYAIDDVKYLASCRRAILDHLSPERLEWLNEDLSVLESDQLIQERDPEESWTRVKGARKLRGKQAEALKALAAWREKRARSVNKPRGHVLKDAQCIEIAQRVNHHIPERKAIRNIIGHADKFIGEDILRVLDQGFVGSSEGSGSRDRFRESSEFREAHKALCSFFDAFCEEQLIDGQLVAVRKDLKSLLRIAWYDHEESCRLLSGWRKDFAGQPLLEKALELKAPGQPELFS